MFGFIPYKIDLYKHTSFCPAALIFGLKSLRILLSFVFLYIHNIKNKLLLHLNIVLLLAYICYSVSVDSFVNVKDVSVKSFGDVESVFVDSFVKVYSQLEQLVEFFDRANHSTKLLASFLVHMVKPLITF